MSTTRKCEIYPGPCDMDLMMSLFGRGRGTGSVPPSVIFTIQLLNDDGEPTGNPTRITAQITLLKHKGHHQRSAWFFEAKTSGNALIRWSTIEGDYDHRTRKGQAIITVD